MLKKLFERLNLKQKVLFPVILFTVLALVVNGILLFSALKEEIIERASIELESKVKSRANELEMYLQEKLMIIRSASKVVVPYTDLSTQVREANQLSMFQNILLSNPEFLSVWVSWELEKIDFLWDHSEGNVQYRYFNNSGSIRLQRDTLYVNGYDREDMYFKARQSNAEKISSPYLTDIWQPRSPTVTFLSPMFRNGNFIGVIGAEISLHNLSRYSRAEADEKVFMMDQEGLILAHNKLPGFVGKNIEDIDDGMISDFERNLLVTKKGYTGLIDEGKNLGSVIPFQPGNTGDIWYFGIVSPTRDLFTVYRENKVIVLLIAFLGIGFMAFIILKVTSFYEKSIGYVGNTLKKLSKGEFGSNGVDMAITEDQSVDIGPMIKSIKTLKNNLSEKARFTRAIGEGNLDVGLEYSGENDELSEVLVSLKENLAKTRKEAEIRRWTSEGLAQFSDILRGDTKDFKKFCESIINNLVNYLGANQGAVYLVNEESDENRYLEMLSAFAYERHKYIEKKIEIGEGLIGQCFLEKQSIYLKEIPEDYVNITSGLGKAVPRVLLVCPLKVEEEVIGVIELASFTDLEGYKINFVEKLGENIALTISGAKANENTRKLLEQSQYQSEQLRSAEEEMRQNMEELQATQEEVGRRAKETEKLLDESRRKNELVNLQIEISNNLSSAVSSVQVYENFLKELCINLHFQLGHVYQVETKEGNKVLQPMGIFYYENEKKYIDFIELTKSTVFDTESGVIGDVFKEEKSVFFEDVTILDHFKRKDAAAKSGLHSVYAFPIWAGKGITAIVEFYADKVLKYDELVDRFTEQMGTQIGDVLSRVKLSESSMKKVEEMVQWQFNVKSILDGFPSALIVCDEEGTIEDFNKPVLKLTGLKSVGIKKTNFYSLFETDIRGLESNVTHSLDLKNVEGNLIKVNMFIRSIVKVSGERKLYLMDSVD
ncbi:MAG: GAF domain-containing protein [Cyclobacteriaceae bacterium]|nr:GAF domain-containing protein [Cyclobacteriaceae bacterium]